MITFDGEKDHKAGELPLELDLARHPHLDHAGKGIMVTSRNGLFN